MSSPDNHSPHDGSPSTRNSSTNYPFPDVRLPSTTNPPGPQNPPHPAVWLIFGATGHFGRFIVEAALRHGDSVCAVGKSFGDSLSAISSWHDDKERFLGLLCDVRIRDTVASVLDQCLAKFGGVDIIVNCTGYGVVGSCEDQDEYEVRNQFETNFMGTLNIIQLSLPYFRERQDGRYLIFSSTSGALGVPGIGPFCATKNAVEGLVESMLYEVDGFGIKLTLVEPGHIRREQQQQQQPQTNDRDIHLHTQKIPMFGHFQVAKASEPYEGKDAPAAHWKRVMQWIGDNAPTSPVRAAELVWQLGHCSYPPLRLLLGTYAVDSIRDRLKSIIEEIEDWKHLSFPPVEGQEQELDQAHDDGERDHEDDHEHDHEHEDEHEHEHERDDEIEQDLDYDGADATKTSSPRARASITTMDQD